MPTEEPVLDPGLEPGVVARSYARRLGWPVTQGTWLTAGGTCSCREPACPLPGAHPLSAGWRLEATRDDALLGTWWTARPAAGIVAPTGACFDVLDLPAGPGREATRRLAEMGYRRGPVAVTGGRVLFFVEVGARSDGYAGDDATSRYAGYDLVRRSEGDYVTLPPSAGTRWLSAPQPGVRSLPAAAEIIGTLAGACAGPGPAGRGGRIRARSAAQSSSAASAVRSRSA